MSFHRTYQRNLKKTFTALHGPDGFETRLLALWD